MLSEADLLAKRAALRWLAQQHPQWAHQDLADALAMLRSWVSKWLWRLRQADPADVVDLNRKPSVRTRGSHPRITSVLLVVRPPSALCAACG
jgi:hypothetical protein